MLIVFWCCFDYIGLKYFVFGFGLVVMVRLLMNFYVFDYYLKSVLFVFGWLIYMYLVLVVCLFGVWFLLCIEEVLWRCSWECFILGEKFFLFVNYVVTGVLLFVFVWINLMIFEYFVFGSELVIFFDRLFVRDFMFLIVWVFYVFVLFVLGMWWQSIAFCVTSFVFILGMSGKVFFYDFVYFGDFYCVVSFVGFVIFLIVILFVY